MILSEIVLFVRDLEGSARFYRETLGLRPFQDGASWKSFQTGAATLCLHAADSEWAAGKAAAERPSGAEVVLAVENLDQDYFRLLHAGVNFDQPPTSFSFGRTATLRDPEGFPVTLLEKKEKR